MVRSHFRTGFSVSANPVKKVNPIVSVINNPRPTNKRSEWARRFVSNADKTLQPKYNADLQMRRNGFDG